MDQTSNNDERIANVNVPPPPAEVMVRTMASDIASIAESGGGPPKPRHIKVSLRTAQKDEMIQPRTSIFSHSASGAPKPPSKNFLSSPAFLISSIAVFLAGIFFAAYYFVYPWLNPALETSGKPAAALNTDNAPFEHKSFLGQPVDGVFALTISSPINGFSAENDQIKSFVSDLSGSFFEITPQDSSGQPLSAKNFFSSIGANIFEPAFVGANFNPDFTIFLHRDKNGIWPGYILQLKTGETPLLLQKDVAGIENVSSSWVSIFLETAGTSGGGFRDEISYGQPIRVFSFLNSSSTLSYGWFFNKYLIISTSLEGMKQAILHF